MKDKRCDLHIHSVFSDSDHAIEDIFLEAKRKNIDCIAVADHDTVDGLTQARICSKSYDIELIEALELSARHKDSEIHILGYFIDPDNERLKLELERIRQLRRERLLWMSDKLNSLGVKVDSQEMFSNIKDSIPTRLHLGLYLLRKGVVNSLRQAFTKYLSPGRPAYKHYFKHSAKEVIGLIKDAGGLSFLAHPHIIADQSLVEEIVSLGVDGLEVVYPNMPQVKRSLYKNIVLKSNLLQSGGSDAHGSFKQFVEVGEVTIPYAWVEKMREALKLRSVSTG